MKKINQFALLTKYCAGLIVLTASYPGSVGYAMEIPLQPKNNSETEQENIHNISKSKLPKNLSDTEIKIEKESENNENNIEYNENEEKLKNEIEHSTEQFKERKKEMSHVSSGGEHKNDQSKIEEDEINISNEIKENDYKPENNENMNVENDRECEEEQNQDNDELLGSEQRKKGHGESSNQINTLWNDEPKDENINVDDGTPIEQGGNHSQLIDSDNIKKNKIETKEDNKMDSYQSNEIKIDNETEGGKKPIISKKFNSLNNNSEIRTNANADNKGWFNPIGIGEAPQGGNVYPSNDNENNTDNELEAKKKVSDHKIKENNLKSKLDDILSDPNGREIFNELDQENEENNNFAPQENNSGSDNQFAFFNERQSDGEEEKLNYFLNDSKAAERNNMSQNSNGTKNINNIPEETWRILKARATYNTEVADVLGGIPYTPVLGRGDVEKSLLFRTIAQRIEFNRSKHIDDEVQDLKNMALGASTLYYSLEDADRSMYWLCVPDSHQPGKGVKTYVNDFRAIAGYATRAVMLYFYMVKKYGFVNIFDVLCNKKSGQYIDFMYNIRRYFPSNINSESSDADKNGALCFYKMMEKLAGFPFLDSLDGTIPINESESAMKEYIERIGNSGTKDNIFAHIQSLLHACEIDDILRDYKNSIRAFYQNSLQKKISITNKDARTGKIWAWDLYDHIGEIEQQNRETVDELTDRFLDTVKKDLTSVMTKMLDGSSKDGNDDFLTRINKPLKDNAELCDIIRTAFIGIIESFELDRFAKQRIIDIVGRGSIKYTGRLETLQKLLTNVCDNLFWVRDIVPLVSADQFNREGPIDTRADFPKKPRLSYIVYDNVGQQQEGLRKVVVWKNNGDETIYVDPELNKGTRGREALLLRITEKEDNRKLRCKIFCENDDGAYRYRKELDDFEMATFSKNIKKSIKNSNQSDDNVKGKRMLPILFHAVQAIYEKALIKAEDPGEKMVIEQVDEFIKNHSCDGMTQLLFTEGFTNKVKEIIGELCNGDFANYEDRKHYIEKQIKSCENSLEKKGKFELAQANSDQTGLNLSIKNAISKKISNGRRMKNNELNRTTTYENFDDEDEKYDKEKTKEKNEELSYGLIAAHRSNTGKERTEQENKRLMERLAELEAELSAKNEEMEGAKKLYEQEKLATEQEKNKLRQELDLEKKNVEKNRERLHKIRNEVKKNTQDDIESPQEVTSSNLNDTILFDDIVKKLTDNYEEIKKGYDPKNGIYGAKGVTENNIKSGAVADYLWGKVETCQGSCTKEFGGRRYVGIRFDDVDSLLNSKDECRNSMGRTINEVLVYFGNTNAKEMCNYLRMNLGEYTSATRNKKSVVNLHAVEEQETFQEYINRCVKKYKNQLYVFASKQIGSQKE